MIGSGMVPEADMRIKQSGVSSTWDKKLLEIYTHKLKASKSVEEMAAYQMSTDSWSIRYFELEKLRALKNTAGTVPHTEKGKITHWILKDVRTWKKRKWKENGSLKLNTKET